jgi:Zn-dependent protease
MRWRPTIYLGRWAGIEIRLDLILVVLIGLLFFSSLNNATGEGATGNDVWTAVAHLVLLVAMIFCMFCHELGHAFMCKLRGHQPKMILLSFVGLTFFDAKKAKPSDEFWIAISGPLVNVLIALVTAPFIIIYFSQRNAPPLLSQAAMANYAGFLSWISILNFLIALGNLTPGWPADGARAVRGWLARKYGYAAGTVRAVAISHGFWLVLAGISVVIMTTAPFLESIGGNRPTYSTAAMVVMYNVVFLVMAVIGLYYGWAEKRRVARLGAERAAAFVGPPPEFMPKSKAEKEAKEKEKVIDAEATVDGEEKPKEKKKEGPGKVDEAKQKAKDTIDAGKALYKVAKVTGKGGGWVAKQGAKMVGDMLTDKDKKKKK